jgi:diguanylate cyclase (GGDEF)-like protein
MRDDEAWADDSLAPLLFSGLPAPVLLVDAAGRLLALNPSAEAFWGVRARSVRGRDAFSTLRIEPLADAEATWDPAGGLPPAGTAVRVPCRIRGTIGRETHCLLVVATLSGTREPVAAVFVLQGELAASLVPESVWRDPLTGLGSRHLWEREARTWGERAGCVVFFDLDDLKEINDRYGHLAGDRALRVVGRTLAELLPPAGLAVRYGGDEFVVVLPTDDEEAADAWAHRVGSAAAEAARDLGLSHAPRLTHGVAAFGPGGLAEAVQRADDVLYRRRGILLPAATGGRIILTRVGREGLRGPGDDRQPAEAGETSASGGALELCLYGPRARATEEARAFVAFAAPEAGSAVVEVGAGSGRVTFEGGLAERVGPTGQLLVTDPSGSELAVARRRAEELGFAWLRFLRAQAENLPLASGTVDLVIGTPFLHGTDPEAAVREMARLLRPGGRLALSVVLPSSWPAAWRRALEPLYRELHRVGADPPEPFPTEEIVRRLVAEAGLVLERTAAVGPEELCFPNAELALWFCRRHGLVPALLRDVPPSRRAGAETAFAHRLRDVFVETPEEERRLRVHGLRLVARRPPR